MEITGSWVLFAHPQSEVEPRRVCVCVRCQVTEIGSKPHAEGAKHVRWTKRTSAFNLQCPKHLRSLEVNEYACEINSTKCIKSDGNVNYLTYILVTSRNVYVLRVSLTGAQCVGDIPETCSEAICVFIDSHEMNNTPG